MNLTLKTPPATLAVSLADVKAHLRIDTDDDDALLTGLIETSTLQIEAALHRALITQTWALQLDAWPGSDHATHHEITVPLTPLQSVDEIRLNGPDGAHTDATDGLIAIGSGASDGRVRLKPQPGIAHDLAAINAVELTVTVGYGASPDDVPSPLRQALIQLVAHWHENREVTPHAGTTAAQVPAHISSLLAPFRQVRL